MGSTLVTRRASKEPIEKGGWSVFGTGWVGADLLDPAGNPALRTNGEKAWFGWPVSEEIEAMRKAWIDASDQAAEKRIADAMQRQWFIEVPMIQTGQWMQPTAHRADITDLLPGFALFWNVRRSM